MLQLRIAAIVLICTPVLLRAADVQLQPIKMSNMQLTRVQDRMQVDFEAVDQPSILFHVEPADWRPLCAFSLDVSNLSTEPIPFAVEISDAAGGRTVGRTLLPLRAHESASFALTLNSPAPLEMGMRGEPAIPGFQLLAEDHRPVDLARIASVRVFLTKPGKPGTLIFGKARLAPPVSYEKIVDAYGQYAQADWPGKLHGAGEFASRLAEEQAELKVHPSLPGRDEYGGWASGPQLQATGWFRTAKRDSKWWLVTPSGHLFFSLGMDCVNVREGPTVVEGRESMFAWLPAPGDPLAAFYGKPAHWGPVSLKIQYNSGKEFNFYAANLARKYGADWREKWPAMALQRLRAWGFNTIGNWSDPLFYKPGGMPYTVTLGIRGQVPEVSSGSDYWRHMYDVFDAKFAAAADESIRGVAQERRDDPWCLGYFVDNELPWGNMRDDRSRYGLALGALSLGESSAAKQALVERLRKRYGAIEKWNMAWRAQAASWQELLRKPYQPEGEFTAAMREDLAAYMKDFAGRYFRTIRDALKKYDPHHLYLGARFAWHTIEEVQACAEYCDVVSFNIYRPRVDPAQWAELNEIDKPAIIGEFHMGALDRGMFHTGLVATHDQAERAAMYQDYVRSVAAHPSLVGCHFFKYADEPLTGRPGDGENYNIGFTTVTDTVYPEMVAAAKAVHAQVYGMR